LPDFAKRTSEAAIFRVENPRNTQVLLAVFSLNLTTSGQKPVISSIFKQALERKKGTKDFSLVPLKKYFVFLLP